MAELSRAVGWCALAGTAAASAAVCGKLGGGPAPAFARELGLEWPFRAACYGGLVGCNVLMWNLYVRSLRVLPTLQATVLNTAANLFVTAVLGFLLFGEALTAQWFLGAACIVVGLLLVTHASAAPATAAPPAPTPPLKNAKKKVT